MHVLSFNYQRINQDFLGNNVNNKYMDNIFREKAINKKLKSENCKKFNEDYIRI